MSDLISRQAAIDAMCCACGYDCDKSKFVYNAPQDEQVIMCPEHYALSTLPPAQPETKKGKWMPDENFGDDAYVCSFCQAIWHTGKIKNMEYCPSCGAYMRGEKNGE